MTGLCGIRNAAPMANGRRRTAEPEMTCGGWEEGEIFANTMLAAAGGVPQSFPRCLNVRSPP